SDGMPNHPMMIGIKSWQQQVPLPQPFTGSNAWKIPLHPVVAENPISAKTDLYRGAIALAVNGVPIFNALNNRGDDAYLYGELDEFGGHAGRADDYHYHTAPLHLSELVGVDKPIAYALDGFPIYGLTEPDGSVVTDLDEFNGHFAADGSYHYHGTKTYPYINGGMRGVVTVHDDQIEPQPHMTPIREALQPLQGATITNFTELDSSHYSLEYQINGQKYYVNYGFEGNTYTFEFVDASGKKTVETY
ncbi:MAG TPA: YHYH protein, partial [Anaerolineales bacterium]|nr:YHYH protein [Anaerolineales bacterium]